MIRADQEITDAVIIGDIRVEWELYYQVRIQGQRHYADTEEQAIADATALMHKIKAECLNDTTRIYDDKVQWEVRLWG